MFHILLLSIIIFVEDGAVGTLGRVGSQPLKCSTETTNEASETPLVKEDETPNEKPEAPNDADTLTDDEVVVRKENLQHKTRALYSGKCNILSYFN